MSAGATPPTETPPTEAPAPSFWAGFLKLIPVTLVCGGIGPYFLFHYFTTDDPDVGWMLGFGIAIVLIDIAVAAGIAAYRYQDVLKHQRLAVHGKHAQADVLLMEKTGARVNDRPVVRIRLRIHADDVSPVEVEITKVVPEGGLHSLHRGKLAVVIDPETQEWEIDWPASKWLADPR